MLFAHLTFTKLPISSDVPDQLNQTPRKMSKEIHRKPGNLERLYLDSCHDSSPPFLADKVRRQCRQAIGVGMCGWPRIHTFSLSSVSISIYKHVGEPPLCHRGFVKLDRNMSDSLFCCEVALNSEHQTLTIRQRSPCHCQVTSNATLVLPYLR